MFSFTASHAMTTVYSILCESKVFAGISKFSHDLCRFVSGCRTIDGVSWSDVACNDVSGEREIHQVHFTGQTALQNCTHKLEFRFHVSSNGAGSLDSIVEERYYFHIWQNPRHYGTWIFFFSSWMVECLFLFPLLLSSPNFPCFTRCFHTRNSLCFLVYSVLCTAHQNMICDIYVLSGDGMPLMSSPHCIRTHNNRIV